MSDNYDDEGNDRGALIRNGVVLAILLLGMGGYGVWRWMQPASASASKNVETSASTTAAKRPAGSGPKKTSSWSKLVIGEKAVTADDARQHVRAWAEKVYQVEGLTPEPAHLPKDRWLPFAKAMVLAECDAPDQLSRREVHSMASDLAPVAGEHPVSAFLVGMVKMREPGCSELLEKAVKGLEAQPGSETLAYHAAVGLALASSEEDGEEVVKKRVEAAIAALRKALDAEKGYSQHHDRVTAHVLKGGHIEAFFQSLHDRVAQEVMKTESAKPWVKKWIEGEHCLAKGWEARGGGYANSVSDDGFAIFGHESEKARRLLQEAWQLGPEDPSPAVALMYSSLSMKDKEALAHMRRWFNEVLKLQVDAPVATQHYLWGLRPRWYGKHQQMEEFGLACADTGRFDSALPWVLLQAHRDCASEWDVPAEYFKELYPHCYNSVFAVFEGAEKEPKREAWRSVDRTHAAIFHFKCGRHEEAQKWLEKLNFKPNPAVVEEWGDVDVDLLLGKTAAFANGESGAKLRRAEAAEKSFDSGRAFEIYSEVVKTDGSKLSEAGRKYIESRAAITQIEKSLGDGKPVAIMPDDAFRAWTRQGGGWKLNEGVLTHWGEEKISMSTCEARVGPSFTVEGDIEVTEPGKASQVWLSYGYPERGEGERYITLRFAYEEGKTLALLSNGMGQPLEHPEIKVGPRFQFKLVGNVRGMSLHIDGKPAFENAPTPDKFVKERYSQIGLGAATKSDKTRVKVHALTVRR
ncbi:MAG: hypothetical protein ACO1TE_29915 [Prosthecobacter sp.]